MKYSMDEALPEGYPLDDFKRLVESQGGRWVQQIPKGETQLHEEIWRLPDDRGVVRYVSDHFVNVPSVRAESDKHGEPGEILIDLDNAGLPMLGFGALERMLSSPNKAERMYALRAFASVMTHFNYLVV